MTRTQLYGIVLALIPWGLVALQTPSKAPKAPTDFQSQIQPILKAHCLSCHNGQVQKGGLDLSTEAAWNAGGDSGKLFVAGNAGKSLIIQRMTSDKYGSIMPKGFPALPPAQIEIFKDWINQGASFKPPVNFESEIKPILKARCLSCHTGSSARAGLNLSDSKGLLRVITPGDPAKSVLLQRIKGTGGKTQMPLGFGPLTPAQITLFQDWIGQGASLAGTKSVHWAYVPVSKPAVPALTSTWIKNPIDAFILKRLKSEGLYPSPRTNPETLLRRISLDLTGLPPTLAELDRFAEGKETYEAAINRLMNSPQYGEKMAQAWLDLARYADTNGYEKDGARTAWKYRDWVIDAFNANMPYDKFTVEQLAGDLLPNPTLTQLVATGFNRNTMLNLEGGVDQEEAMYEVRNDRVGTTSTVWLGQTLACARCHDHKYDPLSQKDYYRTYAFFANNVIEKRGDASISEQKYTEPVIPVPSPQQQVLLNNFKAQIKTGLMDIEGKSRELKAEQAEWEAQLKSQPFTSVVPRISNPGFTVIQGVMDAKVDGQDTETYEIDIDAPVGTQAIVVTALVDPKRPNQGAGRADSGNFILTKARVEGAIISAARADFSQSGFSANAVLDEDPESGWAISGGYGSDHSLVLELDKEISGPTRLSLEFGSKRWVKHTLGHFSISTSRLPSAGRYAVPEVILRRIAKQPRTPEDEKVISDWYSGVAMATLSEANRVSNARKQMAEILASVPTALVMREAEGKTEAPIRHRGEFLSPQEVVPSGTPASLGPVATGTRLSLAKWIVNPKNPLTARVQVNRIWEMLFGQGIVETSENFGTQGSKPSHPELLDWLAATYVESGWDTKKLIKLIMSSATYQQSSKTNPALTKKDPYNILLARGPRFRLPAESIRDVALQSSGLLSRKIGGPPVYPFQPNGVWDSPYSGEQWMPSKDEDAHRRAIYTFWKRTAPYPNFIAFDAPSREQCTVRRIRTNSPLQALATLNDPGLFEAAKALGEKYKGYQGNLDAKISAQFRSVTSRRPSPDELVRLKKLFTTVKSKQNESSAWTLLGNVILNLDEAITKE